jgi:hypothetical protein
MVKSKSIDRGSANPFARVDRPWVNNHRLLAVSMVSHMHQHLHSLEEIDGQFVKELA